MKLRDIIALFVQTGCEHNIVEPTTQGADGEARRLSYLINPETKGFAANVELDDDEFISSFEVASWERRLGMSIPKPAG